MTDIPNAELQARVYGAIADFNTTACWSVLQLAQARQYLAEHVARTLLSAPERRVLGVALGSVGELMALAPHEFTAADEEALASLRALAEEPDTAPEPLCRCGHRRDQHVPRPGDWPTQQCTACPPDRDRTGHHRYTPVTEDGVR